MELMFFKSTNCPQCPRAQQTLEQVLSEMNIAEEVTYVDISTVDGRIEALNNMVMETPSLKIDEEVYGKADILDIGRLKEILGSV